MSKSTKKKPPAPARAPIESTGDPDIAFSAADFAEVQNVAMREAKQGKMQAIAIVERMWRHRRHAVRLDLPPVGDPASLAAAQAAVIAAAAGGRITPHEGIAFAAMLDYRRRALDTIEFEGRLREIEMTSEKSEKPDLVQLIVEAGRDDRQ
jgi:hypothetical protein